MWGWLPIVGPLIDGVVSIIKGHQNVEIKNVEQSVEVLKTFADDPGVRLCRDLILFPVSVWTALATWDTIIVKTHPDWMMHPSAFPAGPLEYLPHAAMLFLLGYQAIKR